MPESCCKRKSLPLDKMLLLNFYAFLLFMIFIKTFLKAKVMFFSENNGYHDHKPIAYKQLWLNGLSNNLQ